MSRAWWPTGPWTVRPAKPRMTPPLLALLVPVMVLTGCAGVTDRVVLLSPVPSAMEVTDGGQSVLLDKPYATVARRGGQLSAGSTTADEIRQAWGPLLANRPAAPQSQIVQFEANGARLTSDAPAVLEQVKQLLATLPAAEVIVTGHTDRVGTVQANDRLSLQRAEAVREILAAAGVARGLIMVVGRGEREPLVATPDEVPEPRNRRVEIKLR